MSGELLEVRNLRKHFPLKGKEVVKAVCDVSFSLERGRTFSLVGESGCGKTTCGRTLLGLYEKTGGTVLFEGKDTSTFTPKESRAFRRRAQMIFQDPYSCLDPRMNVESIILEGRKEFFKEGRSERHEKVKELLSLAGLPESFSARFPHELSGGQRQRVGIARALAVEPDLIVCDEPVAALDVSIQAQVINLFLELQEKKGLSYLFISHDLSIVRHISDEIGVMYLGALVEKAPAEELFQNPLHPYTKALFSAVRRESGRIKLKGEMPSPVSLSGGCRFSSRCPFASEECRRTCPSLRELSPGHSVACHKT